MAPNFHSPQSPKTSGKFSHPAGHRKVQFTIKRKITPIGFQPTNTLSKQQPGLRPNNPSSKHSQQQPQTASQGLPIRFREQHKMYPDSSPKRPRYDNIDESERPKKMPRFSSTSQIPSATGLEEDGILSRLGEKSMSKLVSAVVTKAYEHRNNPQRNLHRKNRLSQSIPSDWNGMPTNSQQGMENFKGYLCYRHSLFQALLHLPVFVGWLRQHEPRECHVEAPQVCVGCRLRIMLDAYWRGGRNELNVAIKLIHTAFAKNGWGGSSGGPGSGQEDPEEQFLWMSRVLKQQLLPMKDSFEAVSEFEQESVISCRTCGPVSTTTGISEEKISIIISPAIPNGELADYIRRIYRGETIPADYKCPKCGDTKKPKQRKYTIVHCPDVVVVAFRRYFPNGKKDPRPVPFSTTLDLTEYCQPDSHRNASYTLAAVVAHSGGTGGGHYVCTAKGPDGQWRKFNDSSVSEVNETAATFPGNGRGFTPYLLFYQRIVLPKRQPSSQLQPPQQVQSDLETTPESEARSQSAVSEASTAATTEPETELPQKENSDIPKVEKGKTDFASKLEKILIEAVAELDGNRQIGQSQN